MTPLLWLETSAKLTEGLPWRLHGDYPARLPTAGPVQETSTELFDPLTQEPVELSQDVSAAIAEAVLKTVGVDQLCRIYVDLVRQIPEVQLVLLHTEDESDRIFTLIDAPPFEREIRTRVYKAEQVALEMVVSRPVEFRLINFREIADDLSRTVPLLGTVLYKKK